MHSYRYIFIVAQLSQFENCPWNLPLVQEFSRTPRQLELSPSWPFISHYRVVRQQRFIPRSTFRPATCAIFYRFRGYIGKNFDTNNFPNREIMVGDVVTPLFVERARTRVSREARWLSPAIQHWLFIDLTRTKPELSCFVARWNSSPWNHL